MMSGDDRCLSVDRQTTTALMPIVMAVMNLAILPRTPLTRFPHQEHHATTEDLIQGINTPTTRGTDHPPILVSDIGRHYSGLQSKPHSHCDRIHYFRRHTSHSSSCHCSGSCHPSANGCLHHDNNRHSCTPFHTHHFS